MKICDIVQSYSPSSGGVKRYIANKINYYGQHPEHRHVVIIPASNRAVYTRQNTTVYEVRSPIIPGSHDYRLLMSRFRIQEIVAQEQPDAIETDGAYTVAWIALQVARLQGIPVIGYYHSDFPRRLPDKIPPIAPRQFTVLFSRMIHRYLVRLYNRMDATVVATHIYRDLLRDMGIRRIVRIPLGVNVDSFSPTDSRQAVFAELGLSPDTMLLIFVGRLAGMKHIDDLIAMMDQFQPGEGQFHLLLVGDGEERDIVIPAEQEREDITWMPYIKDRERLSELYSAADLFIHAGTMETFGLVSVEAQACGTRVIGVRGGGIDETLYGEAPLIMAGTASPPALADAVRRAHRLAETPADRMKRRRRVLRDFSWDNTFRQLTALYDHLRSRKPPETFR